MTTYSTSIHFEHGLIGCPEWRRFELEQSAETAPAALLRSLDQAGLSFIVADPRQWYADYDARLSADELAALGHPAEAGLLPLVILNVQADPRAVTANLLGPLVVNPATGRGVQVLVTDAPYTAAHPITLHNQRLTFAEGLIGCPEWRDFHLQRSEDLRPVKLLTAIHQPELSLPVIHPGIILPEYKPRLNPDEAADLGAEQTNEIEWLVLLTIKEEPFTVTANLLGPIAYNRRTGAARQVVQSGAGYPVAQPIGAVLADVATVSDREVHHAGAHA
jgi:flagellar assembly factor FliW